MQVWTDEQFEQMSWHDNHVHGFRIVAGQHGSGLLIFDLDYILECRRAEQGECEFLIAPATLTFQEVTNLKVNLDYAVASAALTPFSINGFERWLDQRERYNAQQWRIEVNWPEGGITFEASGFKQRRVGEPILTQLQWLEAHQRGET